MCAVTVHVLNRAPARPGAHLESHLHLHLCALDALGHVVGVEGGGLLS